MCHSRPLFSLFSSLQYCCQQTFKTFNINLADDWIRTVDLCSWQLPLYQLRHNHWIIAAKELKLTVFDYFTSHGISHGTRNIALPLVSMDCLAF